MLHCITFRTIVCAEDHFPGWGELKLEKMASGVQSVIMGGTTVMPMSPVVLWATVESRTYTFAHSLVVE